MRITRKMLDRKLTYFAVQLGKRTGFNVGNWFIDYANGLYIIAEMMPQGGESHPFTNTWHTARELFYMMDFSVTAMYYLTQSKFQKEPLHEHTKL